MKKVKFLMMVGAICCVFIPVEAHSNFLLGDSPIISILKNEVRQTEHWEEDCSDSCIEVSYEDAQLLMKVAWCEAGNQGIEGQKKVMEVIWNRVQSDDYPDTVLGVISQKNQFQSYSSGALESAQPTAETHLALAEFEKNRQLNTDIVAFETTANHKSLEEFFNFSFTLGDHDFYVGKLKKD